MDEALRSPAVPSSPHSPRLLPGNGANHLDSTRTQQRARADPCRLQSPVRHCRPHRSSAPASVAACPLGAAEARHRSTEVNPSSKQHKEVVVVPIRMNFRVVCRKLYDYVRYDLKEIAFPSSLPDPPGTKRRPKLTLKEKWYILKEATRLYGASWVRDIGPELRPNDYKKVKEEYATKSTEEGKTTGEPTVLQDLAVAARGGAETLKPVLRRIYMTRASTYTSAVKNYVETYQEGLKDVLDEKAAGKVHQQGNESKRSSPAPPPPPS